MAGVQAAASNAACPDGGHYALEEPEDGVQPRAWLGAPVRKGTEELAGSLPLGPRTRVPAHLLSSLWPAVPATVGWAVFVWWRLGPSGSLPIEDGTASYVWEPSVAELAQGPLALLALQRPPWSSL